MVVCYRGDSGLMVSTSSGPNRVYFIMFVLFWCKKESELQKYWMCCTKMVEVLPVFAMKAYRRSRVRGPPIPNLYSGWRWVVIIKLWPFYLQKWSPLVPTEYEEVGWVPKPVWSNFGEEKTFLFQLRTFWKHLFSKRWETFYLEWRRQSEEMLVVLCALHYRQKTAWYNCCCR